MSINQFIRTRNFEGKRRQEEKRSRRKTKKNKEYRRRERGRTCQKKDRGASPKTFSTETSTSQPKGKSKKAKPDSNSATASTSTAASASINSAASWSYKACRIQRSSVAQQALGSFTPDRMGFVQSKATTATSKYTEANLEEMKANFLQDVVSTVVMEDIPPELIMNWDQTGIKMVPCTKWTMKKQGTRRVELTGVTDKRQMTAIFCGTLTGDFLPLQLIYQDKTSCSHPHYSFPAGWHVTHSPKHQSNEETMIQYVQEIIVPYVEKVREDIGDNKCALVITDNFKGQVTDEINSLLDANDIDVCLLQPNCTN